MSPCPAPRIASSSPFTSAAAAVVRQGGSAPFLFFFVVISVASSATSVVVAAASETTDADCSITCRHGSTCTAGDADYGKSFRTNYPHLPFLSTTNVDGQHCSCPSDRTAVDCGTKVTTCNATSGFSCFDNGMCMTKKKKHTVEDMCDCTTAHKDGHTMFAGTNCEFEATAVCETSGDGLELDTWFCVNGGTCRHKESNINKKCNCPSDWTGPHCEYPVDHPSTPKLEECTLACQNGGQCKFGTTNYTASSSTSPPSSDMILAALVGFAEKHIDGMHCVCSRGYTGITCDVKMDQCKREGSDENGSGSGTFRCFHGGKCVDKGVSGNGMGETTTEDEPGGGDSSRYYCDCETARDSAGGGDGKSYAGRYCEHVSTTLCDIPCSGFGGEGGEGYFCTNGGKCNMDEPHKGCDCSGTGHEGPSCEFKVGTELPCTLQCKNGGKCRHGKNQYVAGVLGTKFDLSSSSSATSALEATHLDFMHCSCPNGYIGVDCSIPYQICGPKEELHHACLHGGRCVVTGQNKNGKNKYACDCGSRNPFAGQHCEHAATAVCASYLGGADDVNVKGAEASASASSMFSYHSFCTNGGKCAENTDPKKGSARPGCVCPDGWDGEHCQYKAGTSPILEVTERGVGGEGTVFASSQRGRWGESMLYRSTVGAAIAMAIFVSFSVAGIYYRARMVRQRQEVMAAAEAAEKDFNLAPAASSYGDEDEISSRMRNVELI